MDKKNNIFNYIDTPQVTFNGFTSMMRNVYLTSSIGLTLLIFSKNFKKDRKVVSLISLAIILYSIVYGIKAGLDLHFYLNILRKQKDIPLILTERIKTWYVWIIFTNIYTLITIILFLFIFYKKILN